MTEQPEQTGRDHTCGAHCQVPRPWEQSQAASEKSLEGQDGGFNGTTLLWPDRTVSR